MDAQKEEAKNKKYTIKEIKKAFWVNFHKGGEFWFNYLGSNKENEDSTRGEWESFIKELFSQ